MKKISVVLSLLVAVLLVGTGYAAWHFDTSLTQTASIAPNISVTPLQGFESSLVIKDGTTTVYGGTGASLDSLAISLDQEKIYFGGDTSVTSKTLTATLTITGSLEGGTTAEQTTFAAKLASYTATPSGSVSVSGDLATYVSVTGGTWSVQGTPSVDGNTKTFTFTTTYSFAYTSAKPGNATEYETMKTAVTGSTYAINFTATVA